MPVSASAISITALLPELVLAAAGCAVLLVAQARRKAVRRTVPWVTLGGIVAAILVLKSSQYWGAPPAQDVINGGLAFENLAGFVRLGALIFGVLRKELTLIMLATLFGTTNFALVMTPVQMIDFTLVVMLYIPCVATIGA